MLDMAADACNDAGALAEAPQQNRRVQEEAALHLVLQFPRYTYTVQTVERWVMYHVQ